MLEKVFSIDSLKLLRDIAEVANENGYKIYLVGGLVRDILLGKKPKDIDIVVEGNVINLIPFLKKKIICRVTKIQQDLKTAQLEFGNKIFIDFVSTRKEFYGERKGIPIASHFGCELKFDVMRRDFTVNALAISLNSDNFDKVIDYVGGIQDLKNKKLRILHDNSFNDDPTRIIRAFKFSHRLGFTLEEKTQQLQDEYLNNRDYSVVVSPARIKKELFEIFAQNSVELMKDFINKGIYKILSDKINDIDLENIKSLIDKYIITGDIPFVYFVALFFREENFSIIRQFNLTRAEIKIFQDLKFAQELEGKLNDLEIHQEYSTHSKESLVLELLLRSNDNIKKYVGSLNEINIEVTSQDLMLMGVPESKSYSDIFDKLLEAKIKGELPDKTSELRFVRKLLLNHEI